MSEKEYSWQAIDKKQGMSAAEILIGLSDAKKIFGENAPLTIRARLGFGGQIQKMIATRKEIEGISERREPAPLRVQPA